MYLNIDLSDQKYYFFLEVKKKIVFLVFLIFCFLICKKIKKGIK
jgi:hypothetical protein